MPNKEKTNFHETLTFSKVKKNANHWFFFCLCTNSTYSPKSIQCFIAGSKSKSSSKLLPKWRTPHPLKFKNSKLVNDCVNTHTSRHMQWFFFFFDRQVDTCNVTRTFFVLFSCRDCWVFSTSNPFFYFDVLVVDYCLLWNVLVSNCRLSIHSTQLLYHLYTTRCLHH